MDMTDRHNLISETELKDWLGFNQRAALKKALEQQSIPIIYGKGGSINTTLELLARYGEAANDEEIEF